MPSAAGIAPEAKNPCIPRDTKNRYLSSDTSHKGIYFSVEKLAIKVQIVNPNIEKDKSLFRPYKSANLPPSRRKLPDVKLKAPGIHEISPCVIPRSVATISKPTNTAPILEA